MVIETLPKFTLENRETGCCPRFDPAPWDGQEFVFQERLFVRARTINFMHIPLNMGSVMKRTWATIKGAGAALENEFLVLSTDPSPWRGEHYFAVAREVPGGNMARLSGHFLAKVFEGPYREAGKWAAEMVVYAASQGRPLQKLYFFYTTCPRCARQYGKNYVVGFAQVE